MANVVSMAKVRIYLRVAKNTGGRKPFKVAASTTPNHAPLMRESYISNDTVLPTAAFALDLDIDDAVFHRAEQVLAEIEVTAEQAQVAAEVAS